jgi:glucokinase
MAQLYASIDLGGTNISAALADAQGAVKAELKEPTRSIEGPAAVLNRMADLVNRLAADAGQRPLALGIGVPGLVDLNRGATRFLPNLPTQWRDVPVRESLQPKIGCPVFLLNDARAATLGELVFGHGRSGSVSTMIFFGLGTGVGGGVVINGTLHMGPLGAAGEIGHQTVLPDGPLCGCGNHGCLETLVSGPALTGQGVRLMLAGNAPKLHELCAGDVNRVSPVTMAAAARAGEESVQTAIHDVAEWLAIGAANMVVTLHPELIVVGGGVAEMGDILLEPLRTAVRRRVRMLPTADLRIERSLLGDRAGLLGGIALAMVPLHPPARAH